MCREWRRVVTSPHDRDQIPAPLKRSAPSPQKDEAAVGQQCPDASTTSRLHAESGEARMIVSLVGMSVIAIIQHAEKCEAII